MVHFNNRSDASFFSSLAKVSLTPEEQEEERRRICRAQKQTFGTTPGVFCTEEELDEFEDFLPDCFDSD